MKKEQREPWLELTTIDLLDLQGIGVCSLCSFCQYAEWSGSCKEAYPECKHTLWKISENEDLAENVYAGGDCWGFRSDVSWDTACRMIENWLLGKDVILPEELLLGARRKTKSKKHA